MSGLDEPLLTPEDAARLLGVKKSWVYEAARKGQIPHVRIGRHLRLIRSDLERWLDDQREGE